MTTYYKTGRSLGGSVTWGGNIAGPAYLGRVNDEGDVTPSGRAIRAFCFSCGMSILNIYGSQSSDDGAINKTPGPSATRPNGFSWTVGCEGHGTNVTWDSGAVENTVVLPDTGGPPDFISEIGYDLTYSGTWSIVAECIEVFSLSGVPFPSQPNYGGSPSDDWPPENDIAIALLCQVGARITASVSCGGVSASLGGTVNTEFVVDPTISLNVQAFARGTTNHPSQTASASITGAITVNGLTEAIAGTVSHSGSLYSGSASGGTSAASVSTDGTILSMSSELCNGGGEATRRANMEIALRGPAGAYPTSIGATFYGPAGGPVNADAPTTVSVTQESYSDVVTYWAIFDYVHSITAQASATKSDDAPAYCFLRPAALSALGEDPRLWRTLQRGFYRAGISMSQGATLPLDTGTASATGPSGTIVRTYADYSGSYVGQSLNGYRWMRLALTADADSQLAQVKIGSKSWNVTVNSSGHVDIDLLSPTNNGASTDATDSHWPVPSEWGPLSGVQHCKTLTIGGLASGHTYTLSGVTLRRNSSLTFTVLPEFQNWIQEAAASRVGDVTTTNYLRRLFLADTDGKQSLEWQDASKLVSSAGGGTTSYGSATVQSFVDNIVAAASPVDGWTAVDACPSPGGCTGDVQELNCYLNDLLPLMCAGGGGASHDGSGWTYCQAVDGTGGISLPLQMLFDQVTSWYGGCGDVFGFGGSTTALEMRAAAFLRGLSWGTVVDGSMAPVSGATVALQLSSDHSGAGSATTDSQGRYATGTGWGLGLKTYDTIAEVSPTPYPKLTRSFFSRKWHRAGFGAGNNLGNPFNFIDRPGIAFYHETGIAGKRALYFRAPFAYPRGGWDVNRTVVYTADGSHAVADLRVTRDDRQTLIALFTVSLSDGSSPSVYRSTSNDDGATWETAAVAITGGKHPTLAIGQDGVTYFEIDAAFVPNADPTTGGTIQAQRRTCGDPAFGDVYTFTDSMSANIAVADDTFHIQQAPEDAARWVLHCLQFGGSSTSRYESYDDGVTWTLVS